MKKQLYSWILCGITIATMTACGSKSSFPEVTHVPFKASSSDDYGLIGVDGKVLFEDEFKGRPSVVVNGVFAVRDEYEGTVEYFTATSKPKSINGNSYVAGGYCTENLIPVVAAEQGIAFIKKDGEVAFVFKEYEGERIKAVNAYFSDELCLFKTESNKCGYIDTKGNVVIKPNYQYATPFSEGIAVVKEDGDDYHQLINTSGETIAKLKTDISDTDFNPNLYSEGLLFFRGKVYDRKGEIAFRLPSKVNYVLPYRNGYAVFEDAAGKYGLLDKNGEIVIRTKYDVPGLIGDNTVFFYDYNDESKETTCLDFNGNRIFNLDMPAFPIAHNRCVIRDNGEYYFADNTGTPINKENYSYVEVSDFPAPSLFLAYTFDSNFEAIQWVHSDYINTSEAVSSVLNVLNREGAGTIKIGMPVTELRNYYNMGESSNYLHDYWHNFQGVTGSEQLGTNYQVQFTEYIADFSGYNRNAKVQHIFINMDWSRIDASNVAKRIREATISYLDKIGFIYDFHNDDWMNEAWDIYKSSNHNYLIAVNEDGSKLCLEAN